MKKDNVFCILLFLIFVGYLTAIFGFTSLYEKDNKSVEYVNHEFIELEAWDEKDLTGLSYDSVTKIIYMFTTVKGVRIYEPYYVMNGDNEPVVGVYDGSKQME